MFTPHFSLCRFSKAYLESRPSRPRLGARLERSLRWGDRGRAGPPRPAPRPAEDKFTFPRHYRRSFPGVGISDSPASPRFAGRGLRGAGVDQLSRSVSFDQPSHGSNKTFLIRSASSRRHDCAALGREHSTGCRGYGSPPSALRPCPVRGGARRGCSTGVSREVLPSLPSIF